MGIVYEKWRELDIDPFDIEFKKIKIRDIISYPPAGNDVVECVCAIDDNIENIFIKIERSKVCDFITETYILNYLKKNKYYNKIPAVIESGKYNNKNYIVLNKIDGERLSDIINKGISLDLKKELLYKYGRELAIIHNINISDFDIAKQRIINDIPNKDIYNNFDDIKESIDYLNENKPNIKYDTFIHGDFHYGNLLWHDNEIIGVLDWEYGGKGFKEQDIAWSCILRPGQKFMDNIEDINDFLKGYSSVGNYDIDKFKWCLINGYCHFYLMNKNNNDYKEKLLYMINVIKNM